MLLLAAALAGSAVAARADERKSDDDGDFWAEIAQPWREPYRKALAEGMRQMATAHEHRRDADRQRAARRAAAEAFARAVKIAPREARGHHLLGKTLCRLDKMRDTVRELELARRLDPKLRRDASAAFCLGIAYSKLERFERAIAEYDRTCQLDPRRRAVANGNAAESLMALGRLEEAIQRYREALRHSRGGDRRLFHWGLAVALDRDEQISKAMAEVNQAIDNDPQMAKLKDPLVFFTPPGEVHYYYALGYLAQGKLDQARARFERFLKKLPDGQWAFRARAHLERLGRKPQRRAEHRPRLAPKPSPASARKRLVENDRRAVRRRVAHAARLIRRKCYRHALRGDRSLGGQMRVRLVVKKNGRVRSAKIAGSTVGSKRLERCVVNVIRRQTRPGRLSSGKAVVVNIPLRFKPK